MNETPNTNTTEKETKGQRFTRLAPARVEKVLDSIDNLEKLTERAYEHTPEQTEKIFSAISDKLKECLDKFNGVVAEEKKKFTL